MEIVNRFREAADARAVSVRNVALITDVASVEAEAKVFAASQEAAKQGLRDLQTAATKAQAPQIVLQKTAAIAEVWRPDMHRWPMQSSGRSWLAIERLLSNVLPPSATRR
jgi:hypothetical protein